MVATLRHELSSIGPLIEKTTPQKQASTEFHK